VELAILRRNGRDLKKKWDGCDAARTAGMKPAPIPASAPKTKEYVVRRATVTRKGGEIVVSGQVRFQPNTADIVPATEPALAALEAFLKKEKGIGKVRIEGHTDPPNSRAMVDLSLARARKVAAWLVGHGIDAGRVIAVGCGGNRPVMKAKEVDRARSRRTEAHVVEDGGKQIAQIMPADCYVE
jgi:outer membrane protein OmpA-like peptidoglycan-associated protein